MDIQTAHPFDQSCVEADMVTKVFGPFWDLEDELSRSFWKTLLAELDIDHQLDWSRARVQFSPHPPHHGGQGREIGDIVLLDPETLNVVFEAKAPFRPADEKKEGDKRRRAVALAEHRNWPQPVFVRISTRPNTPTNLRLLEWHHVAGILRSMLGSENAATSFIENQIELQRKPKHLAASTRPSQKPTALVEVENMMRSLRIPAEEPDWVERMLPHWSYRFGATPLVVLPGHDDAVILRLKTVPEECIESAGITIEQDWFSSSPPQRAHRYSVYLAANWETDSVLADLVGRLLLHAFGMETC